MGKMHDYPWRHAASRLAARSDNPPILSVSGCRIVEATRLRPVLDLSIVPLSLAVFRRGNLAAGLSSARHLAQLAVWMGGEMRGTGRRTGGARSRNNQLGAVKQSIVVSIIAGRLSMALLSWKMRGRHIFYHPRIDADFYSVFSQSVPLDFDSVRLAIGVCDGD